MCLMTIYIDTTHLPYNGEIKDYLERQGCKNIYQVHSELISIAFDSKRVAQKMGEKAKKAFANQISNITYKG